MTYKFIYGIRYLLNAVYDNIRIGKLLFRAVAVAAADRLQLILYSRFNIVEAVTDNDELAFVERLYFAEYLIFRQKVIILAAVEKVEESVKTECS